MGGYGVDVYQYRAIRYGFVYRDAVPAPLGHQEKQMSDFERGLSDDFVCSLNDLYRDKGWWADIVNDPQTFVAIRKDYINVYYRGASLVRVEHSKDGIAAHIHYKYLLAPSLPKRKQYVRFGASGEVDEPSTLRGIVRDRIDSAALKAAARNYVGDEKSGVHAISLKSANAVVDVEIAISKGGRAPRIDIASLVDDGDTIAVRFFEAKAFSSGELRAENDVPPAVVKQINAYSVLVRERESQIVSSYQRMCENLAKLDGIDLTGRRGELVNAVAANDKRLSVDKTPTLVVFGFDQDQRDGKVWRKHWQKLQQQLARKPIAFGKAGSIQR